VAAVTARLEPRPLDHAAALLALTKTRGLSLRQIRRLVEKFGDGSRAFEAVAAGTPEQLGLGAIGSASRARPTVSLGRGELQAASEVIERAVASGLRVTSLGSPGYPSELLQLGDPPPVLFIRGPGALRHDRSVAIVGTRTSSSYGRRSAYGLARELGGWGWTVVSGMARGVDAAAHAGVLDAGGGSIGVLGSGHDHEYPAENRRLYRRMRAEGLLVSEFEPTSPPTRHSFPRRNRIIAALSRAVVVVEAGARSGALITAEHALDLGREVLSVPGRIDEAGSVGSIKLLKQGAAIAAGARDVFDALGWLHNEPAAGGASATTGPGTDLGRRMISLLGAGGLSADEIALKLDTQISETLQALGRLELEGWLERHAGGQFSLTASSARA